MRPPALARMRTSAPALDRLTSNSKTAVQSVRLIVGSAHANALDITDDLGVQMACINWRASSDIQFLPSWPGFCAKDVDARPKARLSGLHSVSCPAKAGH